MTVREISTWAREHGHGLVIEERRGGSGFVAVCGCGYRSTFRRTKRLAAEAAIHHMSKALREARSNGATSGGTHRAPGVSLSDAAGHRL